MQNPTLIVLTMFKAYEFYPVNCRQQLPDRLDRNGRFKQTTTIEEIR